MATRLHSLDSLRYFDAAARHLSFTAAAADLCISQSAVSQKIIQLEARLGYPLFERKTRQLSLTDNGALLFQSVHSALIQIRDTLDRLETREQTSRLDVYCMPAFAIRWMMPCLNDFHKSYPNMDLNLLAELAEPNFRNEHVDIGICHGIGDQPTMEQRLLFKDYIYPVASPDLLKKIKLETPHDLKNTTLLHDSLPQAKLSASWQQWLSERNVNDVDYNSGYQFNQADLIVRAAIEGQGVALAHHILVAKEVESGRLVPLFNEVSESEGVYIVCLKKFFDRPQTAIFYNWMLEQAEIFEQQYNIKRFIPGAFSNDDQEGA
ncbi:MAG: transcriptional regulator GcvA [Arenicella sp.]